MPSGRVPDAPPVWARPRSRTRQARLDRGSIVDAAIAVADAEGLDAVTIRRVADALGSRPMSLYAHVHGKDDLFDLMFDRVAGDAVLGDALPDGWRPALTASARRTREVALAHPWASELLGRRMQLGPNTLRVLDEWMRAIRPLGLEPAVAWAVVSSVNDFVTGEAARSAALLRAVPTDPSAAQEWRSAVDTYLHRRAESGDHPDVAPLLRGGFARQADSFETGLGLMLDGIAAGYAT